MLYGRRLDEALEHVDGSRYALVHAVAKRARQITLWLTADPAELRSEDAPPPAPGELSSRDPVALSEQEILQGEVRVRWDPDGTADERELPDPSLGLDADALLMDGLPGDEEDVFEADEEGAVVAPALAQALEAAEEEEAEEDEEEAPVEEVVVVEEVVAVAGRAEDLGDDLDSVDDLLDAGADDIMEVGLETVEDEELDEEEPLD